MIKVFDPEITFEDKKAVADCLTRGELSGRSPIVGEFERAFADYCGVKHAISVNSGSSALFLSLVALGLSRFAKVAVPTFGYIAVPNAVVQAGYTPVFIDVEPTNGNIDLWALEREAKEGIDAVVVIHTYGFPVNMGALMRLSSKYRFLVIEDAAEAHGAESDGRKVGSIGDIGCFSFFANKIITTGEGGMITTDDDIIADTARSLRDQYNGTKRYYHEDMGYSLCMPALSASLGLSQLARIEAIIARKREIAARYKTIKKVEHLFPDNGTDPVYWAYGILHDCRDELMDYLAQAGIETRPFFTAYHNNPFYRGNPIAPVAEYLQNNGLYLPSSHTLTNDEIEYVIETIRTF